MNMLRQEVCEDSECSDGALDTRQKPLIMIVPRRRSSLRYSGIHWRTKTVTP